MKRFYEETGCEFDGPFGVGTYLGDDIISYPDGATALNAGMLACTEDDRTVDVYGPNLQGRGLAVKIAVIQWDGTKAVRTDRA